MKPTNEDPWLKRTRAMWATICARDRNAKRVLTLEKLRDYLIRQALIRASSPSCNVDTRSLLWRCSICGYLMTLFGKAVHPEKKDGLSVDHVVPLVRGGTSDVGNLAVVCLACNTEKGPLPSDGWLKVKNLVDGWDPESRAYFYRRWNTFHSRTQFSEKKRPELKDWGRKRLG